jgi:hypothetical protein
MKKVTDPGTFVRQILHLLRLFYRFPDLSRIPGRQKRVSDRHSGAALSFTVTLPGTKKLLVERILLKSATPIFADKVGGIAGCTATSVIPRTPAGRQARGVFTVTFAVIFVGRCLQAGLRREVHDIVMYPGSKTAGNR